MLGIFIYGVDEYNQQFRRQEIAYCLNSNSSTSWDSDARRQKSLALTKFESHDVKIDTSKNSMIHPLTKVGGWFHNE
jgi:hypothetical protein